MNEIVRKVAEMASDMPGPTYITENLGGIQAVWEFSNGYGASVINNMASYDTELAVLHNGDITYDTPITRDVVGYIKSPDELLGLLRQIRDLTRR